MPVLDSRWSDLFRAPKFRAQHRPDKPGSSLLGWILHSAPQPGVGWNLLHFAEDPLSTSSWLRFGHGLRTGMKMLLNERDFIPPHAHEKPRQNFWQPL